MNTDGRWIFYRDALNLWRWEHRDATSTMLKKSTIGYATMVDCVLDAVDHGYVGGGMRTKREADGSFVGR
jgi:hypothetical protein